MMQIGRTRTENFSSGTSDPRSPVAATAALVILLCGSFSGTCSARASTIDAMIRVRLATGLYEGQPLVWSESQVFLLSRDGALVTFRPDAAKDYQKIASQFSGYSSGEMRGRLYQEFGHNFEVTGTNHYLVVHPRGQKQKWAGRFEDLYRSFYHYFRVRGMPLDEPRCMLVAVVFPSQAEYIAYARKTGEKVTANFLGHYSATSNRIYLYDSTAGQQNRASSDNLATIIHEATHQTAFNTGVHARFSGTPRWVTEGLATMFEAPGVYNSSQYRDQKDRINRGRLAQFKQYRTRRDSHSLKRLIATDVVFQSDPAAAYSEAWALSFYLCETRPRLYAKYLSLTAGRPPFRNYSTRQRLEDFTQVFGDNFEWLDAQFLRYMDAIK